MSSIARDFLIWMFCFGGMSLAVLIAAHAGIKRYRKRTITDSDRKRHRAILGVLVVGLYGLTFGPVTLDLVRFLNDSTTAEPVSQHVPIAAAAPSDDGLVPVPDPISTY